MLHQSRFPERSGVISVYGLEYRHAIDETCENREGCCNDLRDGDKGLAR
jgi:hypothetical protein